MCLYSAELSDVPATDDGLAAHASAAVCHRPDLVERLDAQRTPQPVSSLLQPGGLEPGYALGGAGQVADLDLCTDGPDRTGGGRHAVPQAGADRVWHGDASRPVDLQPSQAAGELGTRLGGADDAGPLPLGADQGLGLADRLSAVPQSAGTDQGEEDEDEKAPPRSEPSHAAATLRRTVDLGSGLVSRAKVRDQRPTAPMVERACC
jgi:hypothetical protein